EGIGDIAGDDGAGQDQRPLVQDAGTGGAGVLPHRDAGQGRASPVEDSPGAVEVTGGVAGDDQVAERGGAEVDDAAAKAESRAVETAGGAAGVDAACRRLRG